MSDHSDLVQLDAVEAVRLKFARGRERYGRTWVGPHPVLCAHDEILDALAYLLHESDVRELRTGEENEFDTVPAAIVKEVSRLLFEALHGVRMLVDVVGIDQQGGESGAQDGAT